MFCTVRIAQKHHSFTCLPTAMLTICFLELDQHHGLDNVTQQRVCFNIFMWLLQACKQHLASKAASYIKAALRHIQNGTSTRSSLSSYYSRRKYCRRQYTILTTHSSYSQFTVATSTNQCCCCCGSVASHSKIPSWISLDSETSSFFPSVSSVMSSL